MTRVYQQMVWTPFCRKPALTTSNTRKKKKWPDDLDKMKLNGPGRQALEKKNSLAVSEACMAIFWSTPGFNGFSTEGVLMSAIKKAMPSKRS